jgi:hypothetical protein
MLNPRLTFIRQVSEYGAKYVIWEMRCYCGKIFTTRRSRLMSGVTQSCGCHRYEARRRHGHKQGKWRSKTYVAWINMKARCSNPKQTDYASYGGRGIKVDPRWANDFRAFLEDMGEGPAGFVIDRIDPDGNYEASNCRWLMSKYSNMNKRKSTLATKEKLKELIGERPHVIKSIQSLA